MDEEAVLAMQEIRTLAGMFQQILHNCKALSPLFADFFYHVGKVEAQVRQTGRALTLLLHTFQNIVNAANNSNGSSKDIGLCFTRILSQQKALESYLLSTANLLSSSTGQSMKERSEEFKRKITNLDKEHAKDFKKVHHAIKRKLDFLRKLERKSGKDGTQGPSKQPVNVAELIAETRRSLRTDYKVLEEQERQAVRRISLAERLHFCSFLASMKPYLLHQHQEEERGREHISRLDKILSDPENFPTTEEIIRELKLSELSFNFTTPPHSPRSSLLGSRCGSLRSLSSFISGSRPASPFSGRAASPFCLLDEPDAFPTISSNGRADGKRLSTLSINSTDSCQLSPPDSLASQTTLTRGRSASLLRSQVTSSPSCSPAKAASRQNSCVYSTVKRAHSPFRMKPHNADHADTVPVPLYQGNSQLTDSTDNMNTAIRDTARDTAITRRPPLPRKYQPAPPQRTSSLERRTEASTASRSQRVSRAGSFSSPSYPATQSNSGQVQSNTTLDTHHGQSIVSSDQVSCQSNFSSGSNHKESFVKTAIPAYPSNTTPLPIHSQSNISPPTNNCQSDQFSHSHQTSQFTASPYAACTQSQASPTPLQNQSTSSPTPSRSQSNGSPFIPVSESGAVLQHNSSPLCQYSRSSVSPLHQSTTDLQNRSHASPPCQPTSLRSAAKTPGMDTSFSLHYSIPRSNNINFGHSLQLNQQQQADRHPHLLDINQNSQTDSSHSFEDEEEAQTPIVEQLDILNQQLDSIGQQLPSHNQQLASLVNSCGGIYANGEARLIPNGCYTSSQCNGGVAVGQGTARGTYAEQQTRPLSSCHDSLFKAYQLPPQLGRADAATVDNKKAANGLYNDVGVRNGHYDAGEVMTGLGLSGEAKQIGFCRNGTVKTNHFSNNAEARIVSDGKSEAGNGYNTSNRGARNAIDNNSEARNGLHCGNESGRCSSTSTTDDELTPTGDLCMLSGIQVRTYSNL